MHEDFIRTGLAGVPGADSDIFSALKDVGANVIMISQVQVIPNCSILAAVGQKLPVLQELVQLFSMHWQRQTLMCVQLLMVVLSTKFL
ncbi:bifunctional aspartokinase/homoserine dehydrogenase 2, chloroplastic-like isoform X2 [Pyrus communis]